MAVTFFQPRHANKTSASNPASALALNPKVIRLFDGNLQAIDAAENAAIKATAENLQRFNPNRPDPNNHTSIAAAKHVGVFAISLRARKPRPVPTPVPELPEKPKLSRS